MSRFEAEWHALISLPARSPNSKAIVQRSRIQAKSRNHGESVAVSGIDRDPFPPTAISVDAQFCRTQRGAHEAGARQSVGNSARAIIPAVVERLVATSVSIRFRPQLIGRPDGALDCDRGVHRRQGYGAAKARLVSRRCRSGGRKRIGKTDQRRRYKKREAKNKLSGRNLHEVFNQRLLCQGCLKKSAKRIAQILRNALKPSRAVASSADAKGANRKLSATSILLLKRGHFLLGPAHL
jgi:hypothetical protein